MERWDKELSVRKAERTSFARLKASDQLKEWWEGWAAKVAAFPPERVWIVDEVGQFMGYGDERGRVIGVKGWKEARRGGVEQRTWVSVVGGGSATGVPLPPSFMFRGPVANVLTDQLRAKGWIAETSKKGWQSTEGWKQFLMEQFVPFTKAKPNCRHLLLVDGHISRSDIAVNFWAHLKGVEIYLLPPHTTRLACPPTRMSSAL